MVKEVIQDYQQLHHEMHLQTQAAELFTTKLDFPRQEWWRSEMLPPLVTQHPWGGLKHVFAVFPRVVVCLHFSQRCDLRKDQLQSQTWSPLGPSGF